MLLNCDAAEDLRVPWDIYFCFIDYAEAFDCVHHNKLWKILEETGIPDHLTSRPQKEKRAAEDDMVRQHH